MTVTIEDLRKRVIPYTMNIDEYMTKLLDEIKFSEMSLEEAEIRLIDYLEYTHQKSFI